MKLLSKHLTFANAENKRASWTVVARETAVNTTNWSVEAHAICAEF